MTSFILLLNIAILINIIIIDKMQNIYDLIWVKQLALIWFCKFCHGDKTFSWFAYELFMLLKKFEYLWARICFDLLKITET